MLSRSIGPQRRNSRGDLARSPRYVEEDDEEDAEENVVDVEGKDEGAARHAKSE